MIRHIHRYFLMTIRRMSYWIALILLVAFPFLVMGHDGHDHHAADYLKWIGNFHPVILHFPIALIITTGFAELLLLWKELPVFDHAARFMLMTGALTAIPTALLGLALGYTEDFQGPLEPFFWWHRLFGLVTVLLALATAYSRESHSTSYTFLLIVTILSLIITGYFGGSLSFGPETLLPP